MDGYSSSAILINYLNCLFPDFVKSNVSYIIPLGKEHSIAPDRIPEEVKLVIAPDAGSSDAEQIEELYHRGIDVLCLDHHKQSRVPKHGCIINNQLSPNYPNKSLCGAGIVYKFCQYLDALSGKSYADKFLDLTAYAIIADVMDLRSFENRRILTKGLQVVNRRNAFFDELIERQRFPLEKGGYHYGDSIAPEGIGWYIAPYINSMVRSGTQEEKTLVFEAMLDFKANEMIQSKKRGAADGQLERRVTEAIRVCMNVKKRQAKSKDDGSEKIKEKIKQENLSDNKIITVKLKKNEIDRNLSGLIANKVLDEYNKPVLILTENEDETGKKVWSGSVRAPENTSIDSFKSFMNDTELTESNDGHDFAFGTSIADDKIEDFVKKTNETLKDVEFTPREKEVDFIYEAAYSSPEDVIEIADYKYLWGKGVEEPTVVIENVKVNKNNLFLLSRDKNPTLKIELPNGISLIKFKSGQSEYDKLYSELGSVTINVLGKCQKNEWNGVVTPQMIIKDFSIIDRTNYDF